MVRVRLLTSCRRPVFEPPASGRGYPLFWRFSCLIDFISRLGQHAEALAPALKGPSEGYSRSVRYGHYLEWPTTKAHNIIGETFGSRLCMGQAETGQGPLRG